MRTLTRVLHFTKSTTEFQFSKENALKIQFSLRFVDFTHSTEENFAHDTQTSKS